MNRTLKCSLIICTPLLIAVILAFSSTYDTATPAGTDDPREADDRMREIKEATRERLAVEHYFALTGTEVSDSNVGTHKDITADSIITRDPYIDPRSSTYGTLNADGATDDSTVLQASIDALVSGGRWELPPGEYAIGTKLTFSTLDRCEIVFNGRLTTIDVAGTSNAGVEFEFLRYCTIRGLNVRSPISNTSTSGNWTSNVPGVQFTSCRYMNIDIRKVEDFGYGIFFKGEAGVDALGDTLASCTFNEVTMGHILDCQHGIHIDSATGGKVAELSIHGGHIRLNAAIKSALSDSWAIYMDNTSGSNHDSLRFYDTAIENQHNGVYVESTHNMYLFRPRFESITNNHVEYAATGGNNFTWDLGVMDSFAGIDEDKVSFNSNVSRVSITGGQTGGGLGGAYKNYIVDPSFGGFSWPILNRFNEQVARFTNETGGNRGLRYTDIHGQISSPSKMTFSASSSPTTGTYPIGAIVWNLSPTSGQPQNWGCSVSGTSGSMDGVTATSVTKTVTFTFGGSTVADDIEVGHYLTIVGPSNGPFAIQTYNESAGTCTVTPTPSAAASGGAVDWQNFTFIPGPAYP